jgi:hypothetical protein
VPFPWQGKINRSYCFLFFSSQKCTSVYPQFFKMPISTSAAAFSSGAPSHRTPWAATPLLLPSVDEALKIHSNATGRRSTATNYTAAEIAAIHKQECERVAQEYYSTEAHRSGSQPWKKNAAFHHYYKKHMCILGMRKALGDSSDSDSENSENYQTKLFKRRMHLPVTKQRDATRRAAEEERNRRSALGLPDDDDNVSRTQRHPWQYRCPSVAHLGVVGPDDEEAAERGRRHEAERGKKVFPNGFVADNRYQEPSKRDTSRGRAAYDRWARETSDTPVNLPNPWEDRVVLEAEEKRLRRRRGPTVEERSRSVLLSPLEQTKLKMEQERKEEAAAARLQRGGGRSSSSLSGATQRQIDHRVLELMRSHKDSMTRHNAIMAMVHRVPIKDPLAPQK